MITPSRAEIVPLLSVRGLTVDLIKRSGKTRLISGIEFDVSAGEMLGIVGESGSGKSLTALSLLRLLGPGLRIAAGEILFNGRDLATLPERDLLGVRGGEIGMIFQEPMTSLNPLMRIGDQIVESLVAHRGADRTTALAEARRLLDRVGIADSAARVLAYPHELSGGMRQRTMIAMALICRPRLLIADEPTTALDVTIQAQILALLDELRRELGMAVILITHDLGVIAEYADRVAVMYAGRVVETAAAPELFARPRHPYTRALIRSMPDIGASVERLESIPGTVPHPGDMPTGCRFHPRCTDAVPACAARDPMPIVVGPQAQVSCILYTS
ncbi:MAG: ABC transporter ATP-binding protein [Proteobacteria bacterium]|nr:ABC transporter ATP-binding protein [Pseudomonadota bacterium]